MRPTLVLLPLVALFVLAAAPSPAAACSSAYVDLFQRFDRATTVARVKIRTAPPPRGGKVTVATLATLKGSTARTHSVWGGPNGTCTPRLRPGKVGIVFLNDHDGWVGATQGFAPATADVVAALTAWSQATTADERVAVLVDQVTGGAGVIASDAARFLVVRPELLAVVTTAQRDRLVAALPSAPAGSELALVLVRLGVPGVDQLVTDPAVRQIAVARDQLTAGTVDELADLLAATPAGPSAAAVAAFERCERLQGRALLQGTDIRDVAILGLHKNGMVWADLAAGCRNPTGP